MYEEPADDPGERLLDPVARAKEKADGFRMHAEIFAVFEACRKFDARLEPGLDGELARDIQKTMGRLAKARVAGNPALPEPSIAEAAGLLNLPATRELITNDYHIHRRPGEAMIVRWLHGEEVATYYTRLQAHFDAALEGFREDERQALEWKKDPANLAYLDALDAVKVNMEERYCRELIRKHGLFLLSDQSADEMNIVYLCDYVMDVSPAELVGSKSAPPDEPTEQDLAWFFKLFSLRGMKDDVEQMCFFTYMQKTDADGEDSW
jgi:hypothetical protein